VEVEISNETCQRCGSRLLRLVNHPNVMGCVHPTCTAGGRYDGVMRLEAREK